MNKYLKISLTVFSIGILFLFAIYCGQKLRNNSIFGTKTGNNVSIHNITKAENTNYAKISIEYPEIKGVDSEINNSIKGFVESELASFNSNAEENWKARIETSLPGEKIAEFPAEGEKFEFITSWEMPQLSSDYISIVLSIYQFSGGAHGSTELKSFNIDIKNNKFITLAELFDGKKDYLNMISDNAISDLKDRLVDTGLSDLATVSEGAAPLESNFEIFTFNKNKITFYLKQYQVGPYSIGIQEVEMYR